MNLLESIRGLFAPRGAGRSSTRGLASHTGESASSVQAPGGFEALANSPNRQSIEVQNFHALRYSASIRAAVEWAENANREQIAAIARYIVDNNSLAFIATDTLANYATPILPRGDAAENGWNNLAEEYFDQWAEAADFSGRFDFDELQRIVSISIDTDGDVGASMDRRSDGSIGLRFWPTWKIGGEAFGSTKFPDGVVRTQDDAITGFRVLNLEGTYETVPAGQFFLLYEGERFERWRGFSAMRRGLNDIRDAREIQGYLKLGAKIESAIQAVIQNGAPINPDDWEESGVRPQSLEGKRSLTVAQLLGGEVPSIEGELKQLDSKTPGSNKLDFLEVLSSCFVEGVGIPSAFLLDKKGTGPNVRMVLGKAQRRFDRRKRIMARFVRWVWAMVISDAVDRRILPPNPRQFRPALQFPQIAVIDLGDQEKADREAVGSGLKSRRTYHGDRSRDWQREMEQVIAEDDQLIDMLKEQSKRTEVPLAVLLQRHGFVSNTIGQGIASMTDEGDSGSGQQKQENTPVQ